jgi:hypothetical protein
VRHTRPETEGITALRALVFLLALPVLMTAPAAAQADVEFRGEYRDWRVYTRVENGERICFAFTDPQDAAPRNVDHGSVFFMISSWASGAAESQPSLVVGYDMRPENPPQISVGSSRYDFFVDGREGFMDDLDDEPALIRSMRRGSALRVTATSTRGTPTSYEFSLLGVSAALDRVNALC